MAEEKKLMELSSVVKCARYSTGMFVLLQDCEKCLFYKGTVDVSPAVNGRPAVYDIRCSLPVFKRVEYIVKESANGRTE